MAQILKQVSRLWSLVFHKMQNLLFAIHRFEEAQKLDWVY